MRRRSNDRFAISFGVTLVAITFLLILDIKTGLNLSGDYLPIPEPITNPIVDMHIDDELHHNEQIDSENSDNFDTFLTVKRIFGHQ